MPVSLFFPSLHSRYEVGKSNRLPDFDNVCKLPTLENFPSYMNLSSDFFSSNYSVERHFFFFSRIKVYLATERVINLTLTIVLLSRDISLARETVFSCLVLVRITDELYC